MIIQLADPVIVEWIMATARAAAEKAGRDPDALECIVGAPSKVSDDLAACREEVRWFPAMVSNHVMDLIERYGWDSDIPSELTDFVKAREVLRLQGPLPRRRRARRVRHRRDLRPLLRHRQRRRSAPTKLRELEAVGVDQFNVYLMTNAQEETLEAYGTRSSRSSPAPRGRPGCVAAGCRPGRLTVPPGGGKPGLDQGDYPFSRPGSDR